MYQEEEKQNIRSGETGIPETLQKAAEIKSGLSFSDVRVHYNSHKPAELGALAYTMGNQIYVGPGQEKYLPHELGHVVQQKQGRVAITKRERGKPINDDVALEREADKFL